MPAAPTPSTPPVTPPAAGVLLVDQPDWQARQGEHESRVDGWTAARRARAADGGSHPVEDFLFTYYPHRPAQLRRWHPGPGVLLLGPAARERLAWRWHVEQPVHGGTGVGLDLDRFAADRGQALEHLAELLAAVAGRPAQYGCFGLHEWAMVFQDGDRRRHDAWPLRLGADGTDAVVRAHPLRCSHFDAFRFFTAPARPLNARQLQRSDQVAVEQPGCLHVTMDCYRWAGKLGPLVPSELTARCFELARDARAVDMRASPYDLSALGYRAIQIETTAGRAEYAALQRELAGRAAILRAELLTLVHLALEAR